ncbi:DNA/RNA helicase domain-containing protein [Paraclostridium bifermentans]|uniref:DNA/RNA helicase domain-containing protein n=1 Tax=Paraclostridium bifermentans TaxID=1490 RepID=UPI00359CA5FC
MNGLIYKLSELKDKNKQDIISELTEYTETKGFVVEEGQIAAWNACIDFLNYQYSLNETYDITCIFEYLLPLEGGRRPDVIMLFEEKVIILEFKNKETYKEDDISQAIGYREDIYNYHNYTRENNLEVESYLVLTKGNISSNINNLQILNKQNFIETIDFENLTTSTKLKANKFLNSGYEPLPDILTATYDLFKSGKLPHIQNISDGDIEKAYINLKKIVFNNMRNNYGKNIVFISGVPGAGKTLVALKFLYNYNNYIKKQKYTKDGAIYLSGNGPLINVIEAQIDEALGENGLGKAYIKGAIKFKREYMNNNKVPNYNVLLFDEAQRAWDEDKMDSGGISEPQALINICDKIYSDKKNVTLVCFVGNGQSIHEGEEKGIRLWVDALKSRKDYTIYLPNKFEDDFKEVGNLNIVNDLHLDVSIRNNFIDISKFVEAILSCDTYEAIKELEYIKSKGFVIKVSRDFNKCKDYIENIENKNLKYGFLISSKVKGNDIKIVKNALSKENFTSYIDSKDAGTWFLKECNYMNSAASEFACQGLEIDFPIVIFGGDYVIKDNEFYFDKNKLSYQLKKYKEPKSIMENIYRVLLTRSRKGMILFIPKDNNLDETYEFFKNIGICAL